MTAAFSLAAATTLGFQKHDLWQWGFVALMIIALVAPAPLVYLRGEPAGPGLLGHAKRLASGLENVLRLPAWAAAAYGLALWSLTTAYTGFVWDVAWHADTGRDVELFTVPHMLILLGLLGIAGSALMAVLFATVTEAPVGWRVGRLRIPYSAQPLGLLGLGALIGFPLDDLWHNTFGIDVTMWSPTHLLMIGAASLTPLLMWLVLAEAGVARNRPRLMRFTGGVVLIGLSTFQLEYDLGIPQWQLFYHPALMAAAAAIGLVALRACAGRGAAVEGALYYLVIRIVSALLIGVALGRTVPWFALYLPEAVLVEIAFLVVVPRLGELFAALVAGLAIATAGLLVEALWVGVAFQHPWGLSLLPYVWLPVVLALTGAVVGLAIGRSLGQRPVGLAKPVLAAALAVMAVAIFLHLPARHAEPVAVTLQTHQVGASTNGVDRNGAPTVYRNLAANVRFVPGSATAGVDWVDIVAWQGGQRVRHIDLVRRPDGSYASAQAVPVGGSWKSLVYLAKGDTLEAVPVAMPADPVYGLPEIAAPSGRTLNMVPASQLLMRESHGGANWIAELIIAIFALMSALWTISIALAYATFSRRTSPPSAPDQVTGRSRLRTALS